MSFRMHRYSNGVTGLAAFCDTCGEQITDHGFVVWSEDDPSDWLVIHQEKCDPGVHLYANSMGLGEEILYLANSAGVDLDAAKKSIRVLDLL